jgi:hypothetical protein
MHTYRFHIFSFLLMLIYFHIPNFYFIKNTIDSGIAAIILLALLFVKEWRIEKAMAGLLLLLSLLLAISTINDYDLISLFNKITYILLFIATVSWCKNNDYDEIFNYFIFFGLVIAAISIYIHQDPVFYKHLIESIGVNSGYVGFSDAVVFSSTIPFINANTFGYIFASLIFMVYFLYKSSGKVIYLLPLFAFVLIAIMSFSKGVTVFILISITVLFIKGWVNMKSILIMLFLFFAIYLSGAIDPLIIKFDALLIGNSRYDVGNSSERILTMKDSIQSFDLYSVIGISEINDEVQRYNVGDHNTFTRIMYADGIFYFVFFLLFNFYIFYKAHLASKYAKFRKLQKEKLLVDVLLSISIASFVTLMLAPPYAYYWIILALCYSVSLRILENVKIEIVQ